MEVLKTLIFKILRYTGLPFIFREIFQKNKVTILMFHHLDKPTAEITFKTLRKYYNLIHLDTFLKAIKNADKSALPAKSLIITFDDGHAGNHEILTEILKYNVPVTIFLCTEIINTNRHFWFNVFPKSKNEKLKRLANSEKLGVLKNEAGFTLKHEYNTVQTLSKEQIFELSPYVNFQSHTMFHPILTRCTDLESKNEIFNSKYKLEKEYNLDINAFAYPNGDYSDREIQLCKDAGYECAITVDFGFNTIHTDPYKLKRIPVDMTYSRDELIVKTSGISEFISVLFGIKQKSRYSIKM